LEGWEAGKLRKEKRRVSDYTRDARKPMIPLSRTFTASRHPGFLAF